MITGKNYIGNNLSASGEVTYKTFNPQKNIENDTVFYEASQTEVNQAMELAADAFKEFRAVSGKDRAAFLNAIADEILDLGDELIDTYMSESGLPQGRAMGERGRTVGQLRSFATLVVAEQWRDMAIEGAEPSREPMPKPELKRMLIPIGPIAVFGASNFPLAFATAGGDTASALAAGCPVVVKSHPMHSGTGELVASAVIKAAAKTNMPNGVFSNLNSKGITVGQAVVSHDKTKGVGFTGSIRGGRALYDLAAKRKELIPVFAEMGSVNPVVITTAALQQRGEELATTYAGSITAGAGQFCTKPGLILTIAGAESDSFIQDLAAKTVAIDSQCMLHPNIKSAYVSNGALVTGQGGVTVVGKANNDEVSANYGASELATVSGADFIKNSKIQEEVFGPFSLVVKCADKAELLQVISSLSGQLTGTLIAEKSDFAELTDIVSALQNRVGRIIFNGVPTGVEVTGAMTHGGPYPSSTDSRFTAVGINAIKRWVRPFSYQDFPEELLPVFLK